MSARVSSILWRKGQGIVEYAILLAFVVAIAAFLFVNFRERRALVMLISMRKFFKEKGQGIVEYAVLLAFVVAIAAYLFSSSGIKNEVTATFQSTESVLQQRTNM